MILDKRSNDKSAARVSTPTRRRHRLSSTLAFDVYPMWYDSTTIGVFSLASMPAQHISQGRFSIHVVEMLPLTLL